ncbi:hypothetical protein ABFY57_17915 [Paenibacillus polymyxa]|uniref:hypothetical protein n=1 Tax=Paenibacillus polymyxa TaxID=1406 RepID=UPI003D2D3AF8
MTKEIKTALLMAASLFMEILDGTIVTTALPKNGSIFSYRFGNNCFTHQCVFDYSCRFYPFEWMDG